MNVFPDFGSMSGIGELKVVIGAMLTIILVVAVLMIIVSAIIWAISTSSGNPAVAAKARAGVFGSSGRRDPRRRRCDLAELAHSSGQAVVALCLIVTNGNGLHTWLSTMFRLPPSAVFTPRSHRV